MGGARQRFGAPSETETILNITNHGIRTVCAAALGWTLAAAPALANPEDYIYVHVKTYDEDDCASDKNIYITINDTITAELDGDGDDFQPGDGDWYRVGKPRDFGNIYRVELELKDVGLFEADLESPRWCLQYMYLVHPETSATRARNIGTADAWYDGKHAINGAFYRIVPSGGDYIEFGPGRMKDFFEFVF